MTESDLLGQIVLGRYRILRPIARGGMGVVYLGRIEGAAGFSKPVVIKRVIPEIVGQGGNQALFVREARILSNLQHPGIVGVIDFGLEREDYLMVLEYVHGYHLGQWLMYITSKRGQMRAEFASLIVIRVLDALHYAHTFLRPDGTLLGIVHRDVSPANILLDTQGNIKLLDFGIARMSDETGEYKTQEGTLKGKLPYIPPEVYAGQPATIRGDIYACGIVLYQLLSGRNPFAGGTITDTMQRVLNFEPPPLSSLRKDLPQGLDRVLHKALAKDPTRRYESAAAFASALRKLRTGNDDQVLSELHDELNRDFNGDMATQLGIESLDSRDAAWRAAQKSPERTALRSSGPPGKAPKPVGDADATAVAQYATRAKPTPVAGAQAAAALPMPASPRLWAAILAGSGLFLAGTALVIALVPRSGTTPAGQHFVVVQDPGPDSKREPAADPSVAVPTPAVTVASGTSSNSGEITPSSLPLIKPGTRPPVKRADSADPAALTRTFSSRRDEIEDCLHESTKEVTGQPQLSVRFSISVSGKVENASLEPAALSGTSLGQCILAVARSTQFGPQPKPLVFNIPITARQVRR